MTTRVFRNCKQISSLGQFFKFRSPSSRFVIVVLFVLALLVSSHEEFGEPRNSNDDLKVDTENEFFLFRHAGHPDESLTLGGTINGAPHRRLQGICAAGTDGCNRKTTRCVDTLGGGYECFCFEGYENYNPSTKTCADLNECTTDGHNCDKGSTKCRNTVGSYECDCLDGYKPFDGRRCVDVDECENPKLNKCDKAISVCINEPVGSYRCKCKDGYENAEFEDPLITRDQHCANIDECARDAHDCDRATTECRDTPGSYRCVCRLGYERSNGTTCVDVNECTTGGHDCDKGTTKCKNTLGGFQCDCLDGYKPFDGKKCVDVNECLDPKLDKCDKAISVCKNEPIGSYRCECKDGYENAESGDPNITRDKHCANIDECATSSHGCDPATTKCRDTPGSLQCDCLDGYKKLQPSDKSCVDINECTTGGHDCDKGTTTCRNTPGSFQCDCLAGYKSLDGKKCVDINECEDPESNKCNKAISVCKNDPIGSYRCQCNNGYENAESGKPGITRDQHCANIDECATSSHGCDSATTECKDTPGSFQCACRPGYKKLNESDKHCVGKVPWAIIFGAVAGGLALLGAVVSGLIWLRSKPSPSSPNEASDEIGENRETLQTERSLKIDTASFFVY